MWCCAASPARRVYATLAPALLSCLVVHSADADRAGFVKNLCETAYNNPKINGKYNVMVFNLGQNYDKALNDVVLYGSAVTDGTPALVLGKWLLGMQAMLQLRASPPCVMPAFHLACLPGQARALKHEGAKF